MPTAPHRPRCGDADQVTLFGNAETRVGLEHLGLHADLVAFAGARVGDLQLATAAGAHQLRERREGTDRRAVDGDDQVARANFGLLRGRAGCRACDQHRRRHHAQRVDTAERGQLQLERLRLRLAASSRSTRTATSPLLPAAA
jgi:hypothetical protein